MAPPGWPDRPATLSDLELGVWEETCKALEMCRLLSPADAQAIGDYAYIRSEVLRLREWVAEHGVEFTKIDQLGNVVYTMHPKARRLSDLETKMARAQAVLGLTASGRSGMTPAGGGEDEGEAELRRLRAL